MFGNPSEIARKKDRHGNEATFFKLATPIVIANARDNPNSSTAMNNRYQRLDFLPSSTPTTPNDQWSDLRVLSNACAEIWENQGFSN